MSSVLFFFQSIGVYMRELEHSGTVASHLVTRRSLFFSTIVRYLYLLSSPSPYDSISHPTKRRGLREWNCTEHCQPRKMFWPSVGWLCVCRSCFSTLLKLTLSQLWSISVQDDPTGYGLGFMVCATVCGVAIIASYVIH